MPDIDTFDQEQDVFSDVGGVIGHPLEIVRDEDQIESGARGGLTVFEHAEQFLIRGGDDTAARITLHSLSGDHDPAVLPLSARSSAFHEAGTDHAQAIPGEGAADTDRLGHRRG